MKTVHLFGTDGIRAKAYQPPLDKEHLSRIGLALARQIKETSGNDLPRVVLAQDTRESSPFIEEILTSTLQGQGIAVTRFGVLPTPALAFLTQKTGADRGIMITASHNPYEDNGIKIVDAQGFKIREKEERQIEDIFSQTSSSSFVSSDFSAQSSPEALSLYLDFLKAQVQGKSPKSVVIDCANGAASVIPLDFYESLADCVFVYNTSPNGKNINADCGAMHPEFLAEKVREHKADMGVSFDGDMDRCVFCDEAGNIVDGDKVLGYFAVELKKRGELHKDTTLLTLYSNSALESYLKEQGISVLRTECGDKYIGWQICDNGHSFGGENSGHIIFGNQARSGDGLLSLIQLLNYSGTSPISEISSLFDLNPQVNLTLQSSSKVSLDDLPQTHALVQGYRTEFGDDGQIIVRPSGTEPKWRITVENHHPETVQSVANAVYESLSRELEARQ